MDLALINANYALEAKLDPSKDAIFIEDGRKLPRANFIATRKDTTCVKPAGPAPVHRAA